MRLQSLKYIGSIGPFGTLFMPHDHELDFLDILRQLMPRVCGFRRMSNLNLVFSKRLYNRLEFANDDFDSWRELDFEDLFRLGPQYLQLLEENNLDIFALPNRVRIGLYARVSESRGFYEPQKALGVQNKSSCFVVFVVFVLKRYCVGAGGGGVRGGG